MAPSHVSTRAWCEHRGCATLLGQGSGASQGHGWGSESREGRVAWALQGGVRTRGLLHTRRPGSSGTWGQGHLPQAGLGQLAVVGDEAACPFPPSTASPTPNPPALEAPARLSACWVTALCLCSPLWGTPLFSGPRPKCRLPRGVQSPEWGRAGMETWGM